MKRIIKVLVSIISLVVLTAFTTGCTDKVDRKTLREEQERLAKYTIQKFEDVKKIEFTSFEQNTSTRTWVASAVINDKIYVRYGVDKVDKKSDIGMIYNSNDLIEKKYPDNDANINNIEIKYFED